MSTGLNNLTKWPANRGALHNYANLERSWIRLRRRAQVQGVRPLKLHSTRHTYANLALASGKSVKWVADQLGHSTPMLTLRTYAHAMREEEADLNFANFRTTAPLGDTEGLPTAPNGSIRLRLRTRIRQTKTPPL